MNGPEHSFDVYMNVLVSGYLETFKMIGIQFTFDARILINLLTGRHELLFVKLTPTADQSIPNIKKHVVQVSVLDVTKTPPTQAFSWRFVFNHPGTLDHPMYNTADHTNAIYAIGNVVHFRMKAEQVDP